MVERLNTEDTIVSVCSGIKKTSFDGAGHRGSRVCTKLRNLRSRSAFGIGGGGCKCNLFFCLNTLIFHHRDRKSFQIHTHLSNKRTATFL